MGRARLSLGRHYPFTLLLLLSWSWLRLPPSTSKLFQWPSFPPEVKPTPMEVTATHSRAKTAPKWRKVVPRSRSAKRKKRSAPSPRAATRLRPKTVSSSPSTGSPTRTDTATGDHLPTPPPMPAHVVKLLADLAAAGVL